MNTAAIRTAYVLADDNTTIFPRSTVSAWAAASVTPVLVATTPAATGIETNIVVSNSKPLLRKALEKNRSS